MATRDEMQPDTTSTKLTYADYLLFPEDGRRHELIDGEHFVTASPVTRHQRILRRLSFAIESWLQAHPVGEMFFAPYDVVLSQFDVVVPDLIYVSAERSEGVQPTGMFAAPSLVVEILSPSTRRNDELLKRRLYERVGVEEYWVVDPELDLVKVYRLQEREYARAAELERDRGDVLTTPLLPGLEIPLEKLLT
jgi:Uma2 family endonuclease